MGRNHRVGLVESKLAVEDDIQVEQHRLDCKLAAGDDNQAVVGCKRVVLDYSLDKAENSALVDY